MSSSIEFDASVWGRFALNRDAFDLQIRRARSQSGTAAARADAQGFEVSSQIDLQYQL